MEELNHPSWIHFWTEAAHSKRLDFLGNCASDHVYSFQAQLWEVGPGESIMTLISAATVQVSDEYNTSRLWNKKNFRFGIFVSRLFKQPNADTNKAMCHDSSLQLQTTEPRMQNSSDSSIWSSFCSICASSSFHLTKFLGIYNLPFPAGRSYPDQVPRTSGSYSRVVCTPKSGVAPSTSNENR